MESMQQGLTRPDGINEDTFNRILSHAMKGAEAPDPPALGSPGWGLKGCGWKERRPGEKIWHAGCFASSAVRRRRQPRQKVLTNRPLSRPTLLDPFK
jgi:hypothetical protein